MAVGCGDVDGVGMSVSVPGLRVDPWRENSGVACGGLGADDVPRDVDHH